MPKAHLTRSPPVSDHAARPGSTRAGHDEVGTMPKAYLISAYLSVSDPGKFSAYRNLAGPAIVAAGGRYVARGPASRAMEAGVLAQTVVVEFDDLATALAVYDTPAYQEALRALDGGAVRDMRIVEGI